MATTKAAGSRTTKAAQKTPARAPAKQAGSKRPTTAAAGKTMAAKATTAKTATTTTAASRATATKTAVKKAATPRASAAARTAASPAATRTAAKTARKTPLRTTSAATATSRPAATRAAPRPAAAGDSARKPGKISPEQALANTRGLLEAKREHQRQPQSWQAFAPSQGHPGSEGFQSPSAMDKAEELHAAESRITPIQGSISTHDRHHQGKRDSR